MFTPEGIQHLLKCTPEQMQRLTTTITSKYRQQWGLWEALREIYQNSRDETRKNPIIEGDDNKTTIYDLGDGLTIPQFMLLGLSNKKENSAGKYGEGIKIASLILTRMDYEIIVKSRDWIATINIEPFEGENIMVYYFAKTGEYTEGCRIEINGLDIEEAKELLENKFIDESISEIIATGVEGEILNGKYVGKLYCKGIYVSDLGNTIFGYNLTNIDTGTDRNFANPQQMEVQIGYIMRRLVNRELVADTLVRLLEEETYEGKNDYIKLNSIFADEFKKKYGDVVISEDESEKSDVVHKGGKFMTIPTYRLVSELRDNGIVTAQQYIRQYDMKLRQESLFDVSGLDERQYTIYHKSMRLIEKTKMFDKTRNDLEANGEIMFIGQNKLAGGYSDGSKIVICTTKLNNVPTALDVLSEELIHFVYGCGDVTNEFEQHRSAFIRKITGVLLKDNDVIGGI